MDLFQRERAIDKHNNLLRLHMMPVYAIHPRENNDYVDGVLGWVNPRGKDPELRAREIIAAFEGDAVPYVGVNEDDYENGRLVSGHIDCVPIYVSQADYCDELECFSS